MNILFIDSETTGLDPVNNTIIELACRLDVEGKTVATYHSKFFNPKTMTDLGAMKVNGVKLAELVKSKDELQEALSFCDWLLSLPEKVKGDIYICGQNVHFDINFIKAMLARYSVTGFEAIVGHKVIDTFGLALALISVGKLKVEGRTNLGNIAKALGIDLSNRTLHTAPDDMNLTAEVLYKLLELMK